ncbi:MAG: phosphate propanoyltransferase [Gemmatimonadetes bacterium]|nr:phosphate propanoyltransferase [Gemmatimonadota bacterium]
MPGGKNAAASPAASGRTVPIGISNRHIHITQPDVERLFGAGKQLTPERPITQPGQFAAAERVRVVGPKGAIDRVRIVGPVRKATQVELSANDCRAIGLSAPVRHSGLIAGSAGITLEGGSGSLKLAEGAIIAARHMHVSATDAPRLGVADGDRVTVVLGPADRRSTLHDVLVRSGAGHATELHLDTDEAHAYGVKTGDVATLVGRPRKVTGRKSTGDGRRPLITERDVDRVAARGETLTDSGPYRVTPAARDRARALGIWREPH